MWLPASSELLDRTDLHDRVRPGQDPGGLDERVVVVAGDDEEAGQLLDGLREGTVGDQGVGVRSPPDRPCLAAVGEPGATGDGATARLEQLAELVVGVEGGLMVGVGAGLPLAPRCRRGT